MIQEYYLKTIDSNQYSRQSIQLPLVYHPETHSSSFVMINATTMEETFMAPLPQRVPFGVHGIWFDKEYLDEP